MTLVANNPGTATVTVGIEDARGGRARAEFTVTVEPPPNQDPVITPIEPVTLVAGETRDITIGFSDPDGDLIVNVGAASSDENVVSAAASGAGTVTLVANNPGTATVTVGIEDARGGRARAEFTVTVERPNRNPEIAPLEPVTLNVGETREVTFGVSDPDEDALQNAVALSGDPNIVQASAPEVGRVVLTGMAPGTATVTLSVEDSRGGVATFPLTVNVVQPNQDPVITPIEPVTLVTGETREIALGFSDPDGDLIVNVGAASSDENVVSAAASGAGIVTLVANNPGTATVTVGIEDARGGRARAEFTVTVEPPPNQDPSHHAHRAGDARRRRDARDRARLLRSRRRSDRQRRCGVQR